MIFKYFSIIIFLISLSIIFFIFANLLNYEKSLFISSNSTLTLSTNNTLLKLYKIEKEVKIAIKNIPININYSIGHLKKASSLVDSNLEKEIQSLEPRIFNQIQNQISDLKILVNTTKIPKMVKGAQISEGLSHIVDLVQLFQVDKIENDTKIAETLPYFFSSLNNDISNSYNNSNIWLNNNQTVKQNYNNAQDINQSNTINSSDYSKTLEYQTAQDYSAGILDFIDNLNYLKPDAFTNYNITKLKNDYSTLNQLINNKTDINEIKQFSFQILS